MRKFKVMGLCAISGTLLQLGSCFGGDFWLDLGRSALYEFIWDNNGLLDFFGDSPPGLLF